MALGLKIDRLITFTREEMDFFLEALTTVMIDVSRYPFPFFISTRLAICCLVSSHSNEGWFFVET